MKNKLLGFIALGALVFGLSACGTANDADSKKEETKEKGTDEAKEKEETIKYEATPKIFLAGDSTVQTYTDEQYIGGWGQYLDLFLNDNIEVINSAKGGRSSRSFINEGRLYDTKENGFSYSFSEGNGKSIESQISSGDYLFIQFGHNDDDTKAQSDTSYQYQRFVPLGEADQNGIYPTISPKNKVSTKSNLPSDMTASTKTEIAKYGDNYYAYKADGSNGTYKGYLKEYINLARSKGAIPVLVTPVARVKFSEGVIVGGPGQHGDDFAYVKAVRQLANEEDCMLIDLFLKSKELLELSTPTYANFLMALKPNDLKGEWPSGYDISYNNSSLGYTGIEGTHYNKYGAYLEAAYIAEALKSFNDKTVSDFGTNKNTGKNKTEIVSFSDNISNEPEKYIDPSNLMSKSTAIKLEDTFKRINVTNPNRVYKEAKTVIDLINSLPEVSSINNDNYITVGGSVDEAYLAYNALNVDDRSEVTNYSKLTELADKVKEFVIANTPEATETIIFNPSDLTQEVNYQITDSSITSGIFKIVASDSKDIVIKSGTKFTYNNTEYTTEKSLSMGGAGAFSATGNRYIEFTTTKTATITIVAKSSGSDDRIVKIVDESFKDYATADAPATVGVTSITNVSAGTYRVGSSNKGMYIYAIIIEYFD